MSTKMRIEDKYALDEGSVFLTGIEAVVRLLVEKQRRDQAEKGADFVNQTYISGYEGSPLGGLDLKIVEQLETLNQFGKTIHQFGVNEKTAASAMLGTQYAPSGDVDAFWYGKAHGTMWIPDEVWLANLAGTSGTGSMVLLCGEDHRSKSSVSPGASDWVLRSSMVPIFYPANVEEIVTLGMHAIHLSRHLGVVTALKLTTPVCDGASTVNLQQVRPNIQFPDVEFTKRFSPIVMALGALPMQRELVEKKLPLVEEYVRLNQLNRIYPSQNSLIEDDMSCGIGLITTGKSLSDVRQALHILNVTMPILQLSVIYPLDSMIVQKFAQLHKLHTIYLIEEPGPFVEEAVKSALWRSDVKHVYGQYDEEGNPFIPSWGEVDPEDIAKLLEPRLNAALGRKQSQVSVKFNDILQRKFPDVPKVSPMSCGGCPYNSFRDLKGEKPGGAIGCSSIRAMEAYDFGVKYIPTMGAGGSIYSGTAPFNGNQHSFQYLGDGSYFHSGRGAVQSCVSGNVNITFLLLFNGAVALTGGQKPGGQRTVGEVVEELMALGVRDVGVVSEEPQRYRDLNHSAIKIFGLDQHSEALAQFKKISGTTALILDKECATEKGRRRRKLRQNPDSYVLIHERLCEGCGDCFQQSEGCAALYSTETVFGDKTQIRQGNCVQDKLCVDGECPSFVKVTPRNETGGLKQAIPEPLEDLPEPEKVEFDEVDYTLFAVGRGGTGVVTISHLIAYAAMIDGFYVYLSNNTGLAQKGGPVEAPIVLNRHRQPVFNRLFPGSADLYLGFDLLRGAEPQNLKFASSDRTAAVVSTTRLPNAEMNRQASRFPDPDSLAQLIDQCTLKSSNIYIDTYVMAETLFGDSIYANMLLLGVAYQTGRIPVSAEAIETAIELNGKAIPNNLAAFRWGRLAIIDPLRVQQRVGLIRDDGDEFVDRNRARLDNARVRSCHDKALDLLIRAPELKPDFSRCIVELIAYQDEAYAQQFVDFVHKVHDIEIAVYPTGDSSLTRATIVNLYKLMAYKDEYEVARLALDEDAQEQITKAFDGEVKISYCLNPPALRRFGWGKIELGPSARWLFIALRSLRKIRGSVLDVFGRTDCRRLERELVDWYRNTLTEAIKILSQGPVSVETYNTLVAVAQAPDSVRGYEHGKIETATKVRSDVAVLLKKLRSTNS